MNSLLTAREYFSANVDKSLYENMDGVVAKIKAVLKHSAREKAERIEQRIKIFDSVKPDKTSSLSLIQSAIANCLVIEMTYHAIHSDLVSSRLIEPVAVYYTKGKWLLIAYCRLREALREFRIDRILNLSVTGAAFPERHFSFEEYLSAMAKNS